MKAAVLKELGLAPVYEEVDDPRPSSEDEVVINMKAVALKNIDKLMAGGTHYASYKKLPVVVGSDGVGMLQDGSMVYTAGRAMLAEKAVVNASSLVKIPAGIDSAIAAAVPNAALGSYLPLKVKGQMKEGHVVLINGGTGITGKFAVQLAKYYRASKVVVTGKIEGKEEQLSALGADLLISTQQNEESFKRSIRRLHEESGIDIIIDYLWGKPAEDIINSLGGNGANFPQKDTKFINVGNMVSRHLNLDCNILRSSKLTILGSGLGSYSKNEFESFYQQVLPEMFQLVAEGKASIAIEKEKIENINRIWNKNSLGKRLVVMV